MDKLLKGHFVMLRAGSLRLLLPQADVGAAEYRACEPAPSGRPGVFTIEVDGTARRLVAPSEQLRLLDAFPPARYVLTRLAHCHDEALWFAWDEVLVLIGATFAVQPLPACLSADCVPLGGFVALGDEPVFCTDAARIVTRVLREEVRT